MADVYTEASGDSKDDNIATEKERGEKGYPVDKTAEETNKSWSSPHNPFVPRPPLKTDVVSTAAHYHHSQTVHLAPSKFVTSQSQSVAGEADLENTEDRVDQKSSILLPSRLGILNKAETMPSPSKCLLRPSTLSGQVQNLKQKDSECKEKENQEDCVEEKKDETGTEEKPSSPGICHSTSDNNNTATSENYFAAALSNSEKLPDSTTDAGGGKSEFIFGQNLTDRVTGVASTSPESKPGAAGFVFGQNLADRVVKAESLESALLSADKNLPSSDEESDLAKSTGSDKSKTLEESAREFQAKHDKKPEYKEVEIKTGEEGESNVLQATGKLFVFDAHNTSWIERGRGILRLNDQKTLIPSEFHSRLVMRTHGSLRVILNTKIWPGMSVERASQKSIRITATDADEGIKIFLLTTTPKDTENVLRAVDWRIQQLRMSEEDSRDQNKPEKRKADCFLGEEISVKKARSSDESSITTGSQSIKREESDSSVLDPETDVSSESCTSSSLTVRSESD